VIVRIGIAVVLAAALVGCQKKENTETPNAGAGGQIQVAATPKPQATSPRAVVQWIAKPQDAQQLVGLAWVKGGPVTITPGKVYIVEFWATWCPPCKISIPHLTELQKKYKDKGVVFVGVSAEPVGTVTPFVKQAGDAMDYNVASDPKGDVLKGYMIAFKQENIPTAFIVNAAGKVVWLGNPLIDPLEEAIEQVLASKDAKPSQG
jgi:thiol-disulfide isomerase/thioredoxin